MFITARLGTFGFNAFMVNINVRKRDWVIFIKVLIFGAGRYYQRYKKIFFNYSIVGIIDNYGSEKFLDGIPVYKLDDICSLEFDAVCVLVKNFIPIVRKLEGMGIDESKIINIRDFKRRLKGAQLYISNQMDFKRPYGILITNGLSRTGAPVVLLSVAKVLKEHGIRFLVISPSDGPLYKAYEDMGIQVLIDENIELGRLDDLPYVFNVSFVWINTVLFGYLLHGHKLNVPVFWWIHEAAQWYDEENTLVCDDDLKNVSIACVSEWARKNFADAMRNVSRKVGILPYGIEDDCQSINVKSNDKVVFAIVGTVCERKGQIEFLKAVQQLPAEMISRIEVLIIGALNEHDAYSMAVIKIANNMKGLHVSIIGELNREELLKKYTEIDVLACPSLDDPLPVVATEAMMCDRPCLVSDHTGTAAFIEDGINGWVYHAKDICELKEKIMEIIFERSLLPEIGRQARICYENNFSYDVFEENVLMKVKNIMYVNKDN